MAKRKPKPEPLAAQELAADLDVAEAETHARADSVTDPAAFEFPGPTATNAPDVSPSAGLAEPAAGTGGRPESSESPSADARRGRDPFPVASITLGTDKESPRVRLFRSDRFKQVALRFDEKPDEKYRDLLRDAGFKWRPDDEVWTKQFDPDRRWQTMADAERLLERIGNGLRDDLGLPPVRILGG